MTKLDFDLHIPFTYPCIKFELNMYNCWRDNGLKLKISFFFQNLRGKTHRTMTKYKLELHIRLLYPCVKFKLKVFICWGANGWERIFLYIFFSKQYFC